MDRIKAFHSFKTHVVLGKLYAKLTKKEIELCEQFIIENEKLNQNDFAEKCNRWMMDDRTRPKRHTDMWALVFQTNGAEK